MNKRMAESISKEKMLADKVMSNEDLLLQVLLYLPTKSLIRFKGVSKRWRYLISNAEFCSQHTRLNPTSPTLGIYFIHKNKYSSGLKLVSLHRANQTDLPTLTFIKNAFLELHSDLPEISHACNGLFLCQYTYNGPYSICNIATRTSTILPQHLLLQCGWYHADNSVYLIFEPSKSPHFKVVLLGLTNYTYGKTLYDDDEYKEIPPTLYIGALCYEIIVYSSEAGVWEHKYIRAPHGSEIYYKAVCNGSIHWITNKYHVRFEVESWKFMYNPLPTEPEAFKVENIRYFGECCGRLFLATHIRLSSEKSLTVLVLAENSWTMNYRVNLDPLKAAFPDSFGYPYPSAVASKVWKYTVLCVVKEDETNDFALLLTTPGKVISYNLIRNTFKVLCEFPVQEFPPVNGYISAHSFPLMATLSPV